MRVGALMLLDKKALGLGLTVDLDDRGAWTLARVETSNRPNAPSGELAC